MVRQIVEFKSALVVVSVLMGGIVFGQSIEQRQKADEYKCSFSCKMIGQSGKENKPRQRYKLNTKRCAADDVLLRTFCSFPAQGLGGWCAGIDCEWLWQK